MLEKAQLYFEQSMFAAFYVLVKFLLYNLDIGTISYVLMLVVKGIALLHLYARIRQCLLFCLGSIRC